MKHSESRCFGIEALLVLVFDLKRVNYQLRKTGPSQDITNRYVLKLKEKLTFISSIYYTGIVLYRKVVIFMISLEKVKKSKYLTLLDSNSTFGPIRTVPIGNDEFLFNAKDCAVILGYKKDGDDNL